MYVSPSVSKQEFPIHNFALLSADPNIGGDAPWKVSGVGLVVAVRIIRKLPDRMAEFGDSHAVLPIFGIDIRRSRAATVTEGDLILIGAETYWIIGEPMGNAFGLVSACEAVIVSPS